MFNNKLTGVMKKVDGFIADLQAGIDSNAQQVADMDKVIADAEAKQDAIYRELKAGEALLNNLINLKG